MRETICYIIQKEGNNPRGVHGVFLNLGMALNALSTLAKNDVDDYHYWVLYKVPLNEAFTLGKNEDGFTQFDNDENRIKYYRKSDFNTTEEK